MPVISDRHRSKKTFNNSFFHSFISQWNKLDVNIGNSESLASCKSNLLKFIRPISNPIYNIHNP